MRLLLGLTDQPLGARIDSAEPNVNELIKRALQRAPREGRNNVGFWLARQLRDAGYSEREATGVGFRYVQMASESNIKGEYERYTLSEYLASVRQAFTRKANASSTSQVTGDLNGSGTGLAEPSAYELRSDGVYWRKSRGDAESSLVYLSSTVKVLARSRDHQGSSWGLLIEWQDAEGRSRFWVMPMSLLSGDGSEIGRHLRDRGLPYLTTSPQLRARFLDYLQLANPDKYVRSTGRTGWHGDVFVLPDRTVAKTRESSEEVFFQGDADYRHYVRTVGTLEEWRARVGSKCSGNSRLILAVSTAFAGPILGLTGAESGGLHLFSASSIGKTTALMVAGSVLGGGGERGFIQSWRSTNNGIELLAEHHNHLTLMLDEISQSQAEEAAEIVYTLANEQGKQRMGRGLRMMRTARWKLLFISSGEITLANHIQAGGRRSRGGVEVRLLNVNADAGAGFGLFEDLHGFDEPSRFADDLRAEAMRNYGTPIRALLDRAVLETGDLKMDSVKFETEFKQKVLPQNACGEVVRAAARFALIAFAGKKATEWDITGWRSHEAETAATACFRVWLQSRETNGSSDEEQAVRQVRAFLEAHGMSRFPLITQMNGTDDGAAIPEGMVIHNRAGYRRYTRSGEIEFLVLPETFKTQVCTGYDYRLVAKALSKRGYFFCEEGHLTINTVIPEVGKSRVFCISGSILQ